MLFHRHVLLIIEKIHVIQAEPVQYEGNQEEKRPKLLLFT